MTQNNPFLKVKTRSIVFWLIVAVPLSLFLVGIIGGLVSFIYQPSDLKINFKDPLFSTIAFSVLIYFLVIIWFLYYQKRSQLKLKFIFGELPPVKQCLYWMLLVIPILFFSMGAGQVIYYLVSLVDPKLVKSLIEQRLFITAKETNYPLIYNGIQFVSIVILAPLLEEVLFRGIILQRWSVKWSVVSGIILSSLFFGLLHFNVLGLFNFGLVMALLYLRTHSLWLPIILHSLNNLIAVSLDLTAVVYKNGSAFYTVEELQSTWWQGLIAIALALPWLILFWRNNWQTARQTLPYFANRDRLRVE